MADTMKKRRFKLEDYPPHVLYAGFLVLFLVVLFGIAGLIETALWVAARW